MIICFFFFFCFVFLWPVAAAATVVVTIRPYYFKVLYVALLLFIATLFSCRTIVVHISSALLYTKYLFPVPSLQGLDCGDY